MYTGLSHHFYHCNITYNKKNESIVVHSAHASRGRQLTFEKTFILIT